jgi:thymidylate kinase
MDVTRFTEAQLIIIEGVPGAGKTQLQERLQLSVEGRTVHVFPEEALLFGWMHAWLPGIDELRMSLMRGLVDHIEETLAQNPESLFVLNRFHISYLVFAKIPDTAAYEALLARLRKLAVLVLVPQLCAADIADRALHLERDDPLWRTHLNKRLQASGFRELAAMYLAEQDRVKQILSVQQLPYEILDASEFAYSRNRFILANEK